MTNSNYFLMDKIILNYGKFRRVGGFLQCPFLVYRQSGKSSRSAVESVIMIYMEAAEARSSNPGHH